MHGHHAIDYIEISVSDIGKAKRFYGEAFGWKFTDYSPTYAGIQGADSEMGGLTEVEKVRHGTTLAVIYSEDLEESLGAVQKAGGIIAKKIFSFPGGRRFHFLDPSGNELAVWSETGE
ncbi:VOC family protein [Candidatus Saccharibacteria bacterium]|nr:VOC family protein [Candidatus Saccharibacteria bacterium]